jgi:hypothetical protein
MLPEALKKGFDAWESATARALEAWLKSPLVLKPGGALFTALFRAKSASDRLVEAWWSGVGLAPRQEQERVLHALHRLESRLLDLEERLDRDPGEKGR